MRYGTSHDNAGTSHDNAGTRHDNVWTRHDNVGTRHVVSVQQGNAINQFSKPIAGSVSVIIQQYKSSVMRWCNKNNHKYFKWQSRFYDHIIRNDESYQSISDYIIDNPAKWEEDKFYDKNN